MVEKKTKKVKSITVADVIKEKLLKKEKKVTLDELNYKVNKICDFLGLKL